ncbi:tRNA-queuosine alpha-mannosyltransferase domain-containing protein [Salinicola rhizosphaerae]|uniref:tRNA-queuosine alpha-mannosyltransferase n=1 Tax=Salinicola rhizosphaerae TaxID=1443141 RepID=A0ABQ3DR06_9GAMM|nr:DUF3524 domain-containing protein [Salinicola rhizosphaerae]GHB07525.1 glycosyl transferase family 1 [Salinicola rhizosphaerae]
MRALLLSAYAAVSHRIWADDLIEQFPEVEWERLELSPRHFSWRIRANPLLWWQEAPDRLSRDYDLVVATSMVDLATLVGLFPSLARARKVVYFHENQFAFPLASGQPLRPESLMVNLYAAMAADVVAFNSAYNRDSFIAGVHAFLSRMPDRPKLDGWLDRLAERAMILPVPLPERTPLPPRAGQRILWNHRWEYDKNPETFFAALERLVAREIDFEVAVMGQQFRQSPAVFTQAREWLGARVICWGEQPRARYLEMLAACDIVVSTTHHEFQGLAIMEAVTHGCLPLVPDRLCFPELYASAYRHDGSVEDLAERLERWLHQPASRPDLPDASVWQWSHWRERYAAVLLADSR